MNQFVLSEASSDMKACKVKWTQQEDHLLTSVVARFGSSRWDFIAQHVPGRNGRQCRERWFSTLSPDVCHSAWSNEEDDLLLKLQRELGNHWSTIAKNLPGRTAIMAKNRFRLLCRHDKVYTHNNTNGTQTSRKVQTTVENTSEYNSSIESTPSAPPTFVIEAPSSIENQTQETQAMSQAPADGSVSNQAESAQCESDTIFDNFFLEDDFDLNNLAFIEGCMF